MSENYYKVCRSLAGLSQAEAAELLSVEVRSISNYENGSRVPDDIVRAMVQAYNAPLLGLWHLKENNPVGKECLPPIFPTVTTNDIALQTIFANQDVAEARDHITAAIKGGDLNADDLPQLELYIMANDGAVGKLISAKARALKAKNELMREMDEPA